MPWHRAIAGVVVLSAAIALPGAGAASESSRGLLPVRLVDPRDGSSVELRPGAAVLHVVFFATWCPPCRDELPELTELDTRWGDGGYRLVLVAVSSRQTVERLREFAASGAVEGEVLFDADGKAQRGFGAEQLPMHVVLDARGAVVARASSLDGEIEATIERMMIDHTRGPDR